MSKAENPAEVISIPPVDQNRFQATSLPLVLRDLEQYLAGSGKKTVRPDRRQERCEVHTELHQPAGWQCLRWECKADC